MVRHPVRFTGVLAAVSLLAAPLQAQRVRPVGSERSLSVELSPYGGMLITDDLVKGPLGSSVKPANAQFWGVQLGIPVVSGVAIMGNVGYADSDLKVGIPIVGSGVSVGKSTAWFYDGGLQFGGTARQQREMAIAPFVQVGVGGVRRALTVSGMSARTTDVAGNLGAGLDVVVTPGIALRLMAKDYVGKANFGSLGSLTAETKTMNNVALTAAMKLMF